MNDEDRPEWMLYSPLPKGLSGPDKRPAWLMDLQASDQRLGEESEFVQLPEVRCGKWVCGWLDGYATKTVVVGAFFAPTGEHICALLQHGSPQCVPQPQLRSGSCRGAYQIPLTRPATSRADLVGLFEEAFVRLNELGLIKVVEVSTSNPSFKRTPDGAA